MPVSGRSEGARVLGAEARGVAWIHTVRARFGWGSDCGVGKDGALAKAKPFFVFVPPRCFLARSVLCAAGG